MYDKPISYSGRSLYAKCPHKWHDNYILGNRRPSGTAADRGTYLHELLEDYFKEKAPYPSGNRALAPWQKFMETLAAGHPVAEGEVAVTKDWKKCEFDDPAAYFRGKKDLEIDVSPILHLYDWKSGKEYSNHVVQGKDYAALTPGYEDYVVHFVYLDQPHYVKTWDYTAAQVEAHKQELITDIETIRNAVEYPATPGDECKWCHLSWRKGGDCKRAP